MPNEIHDTPAREELLNKLDHSSISLLTAYVVGLEGVLARLSEIDGKAVFLSSSDFAAGLVRVVGEAIADGMLPAAQRAVNQPIHKNFHDGWPSLTIPSTMDLIVVRADFIEWIAQYEGAVAQHFKGTAVAPQFAHHMDALYEGLGVVARHQGSTRNIRPTRDDRGRTATQQQKQSFNFGMR